MVGLFIKEDIGTRSSHNILSGKPLLLRWTPLLVALGGISDGRVIDGDPIHSGNILGFINSTVGTLPKRRANCEWVFVDGPPPAPYGQIYHEDHCLVIATRTIRSGDELFTHYEWN